MTKSDIVIFLHQNIQIFTLSGAINSLHSGEVLPPNSGHIDAKLVTKINSKQFLVFTAFRISTKSMSVTEL